MNMVGAPRTPRHSLSSQMFSNHNFLILCNKCVKSKDRFPYKWLLVSERGGLPN